MKQIDPHPYLNTDKAGKIEEHIDSIEAKYENTEWVSYDISQWAGILSDAEAGLVERIINGIDAVSMMHCKNPYGYNNTHDAVTDVDKQIELIFDGAKRRSKSKGYNVTVADLGKGQELDNFDVFFETNGAGGSKGDIPIAQGCRTLGSLASVANSEYMLVLSASHKRKEGWTWTVVKQDEDGYKYLKIDGDFLIYNGEIEGVGDEASRTYGTVIRMYNYDMPSPEQAAEGEPFRRMLTQKIPEPPIPIKILDNRWNESYLYEGLSKELEKCGDVLSASESYTYEDNKYGEVELSLYTFDMSDELSDVRGKFITSSPDDNRFLTSLNGQTHHTESLNKMKNNSGLGLASDRTIIIARLRDVGTIKEEQLFELSRQGFQDSDDKKEFVSQNLNYISSRVDADSLTPDDSDSCVSKTDFGFEPKDTECEVKEDGVEYCTAEVKPYLNEEEQQVELSFVNAENLTVDVVEQRRQCVKYMINAETLNKGSKVETDLLVSLDGELADSTRVSVRKEQTENTGESEENGKDSNEVTIGGETVNGFSVPEEKLTEQEVHKMLKSELPSFKRKSYEFVEDITLDDVGYVDESGEFYSSISQLSSENLEQDIYNKIRNKFVASEETRAGNLAEDLAAMFYASKNNEGDNLTVKTGANGCEPDLVSERFGETYSVQLKSGVKTMNADMQSGFNHAKSIVDGREDHHMILGIVEGTREQAESNFGSNIKNVSDALLCGEELWYWLTGNEEVARNFYDILSEVEDEIDINPKVGQFEELIDEKSSELAEEYREKSED